MPTYYVNPDSLTGGNGTTDATTGDNRAFHSLADWEAARQGVLAATETVICATNGTADEHAVVINGWTTYADRYVDIQVAAGSRHAGVLNTAKYLLSVTNDAPLKIQEDYVRVDGIQVQVLSPTEARHVVTVEAITATNNDIRLSNCIVKSHGGATYASHGVMLYDTDIIAKIWNCIIYNVPTPSGAAGIYTSCASVSIYSCVVIGGQRGINSYGAVTVKNTYVGGAGYEDFGYVSGTLAKTNCASEDASADDTETGETQSNCLINKALDIDTFVNVTAGSEDFHLAADGLSPLQGTGVDTTGDSAPLNFTTDIDGQTRDATWDIGADAHVSSGQSLAGLAALSTGTVVAQAIAAGAVALAGSAGLSTWTLLTQALVSVELLAQSAIRWRIDDADEATATWAAVENAGLSAAAGTKRLRVQVNHTGDPAAITPKWQYRRKPSGGAWGDWTTVGS